MIVHEREAAVFPDPLHTHLACPECTDWAPAWPAALSFVEGNSSTESSSVGSPGAAQWRSCASSWSPK